MRDHVLLGVGPGGFPAVYQRYVSTLGIQPHEGAREAHNLYAGLGAEIGVVGLSVFLAVVVVVVRGLLRARREWEPLDRDRSRMAGAFLLALTGYLATAMFLHLSYQRYFWVLLALAVCASELPAGGTARGNARAPAEVPARG
jgi:O-antigen ligase